MRSATSTEPAGTNRYGPPARSRSVLHCPFCGAPETDRFDLEGRRFLVFECMFSPAVDPRLSDEELDGFLRTEFGRDPSRAYFRQMCDRLHLYVTKGEGGRVLGTAAEGSSTEGSGRSRDASPERS